MAINFLQILSKGYKSIFEDYNLFIVISSFVILPCILTYFVISRYSDNLIFEILSNSLTFLSIIIGFLMSVLIFLLTFNRVNLKSIKKKNLLLKLKKNLSYVILTSITIGTLLVIFILFYDSGIFVKIVDFLIPILLFLLFHFMMLLLNVFRKFSVIVEDSFNN